MQRHVVSGANLIRPESLPFAIWGEPLVDEASKQQMHNAMRLPITVAGVLMPDAHVGYGVPIGGVIATEGAVIPYAVGVDIACRMRLSVFDAPPALLQQQRDRLARILREHTRFGAGAEWKPVQSDAVMDDPDWEALPLLRALKDKAARQLGTSGSGNHFVEFGELEVVQPGDGFPPGRHLALLSHSGSRGVGYQIAEHYSRVARAQHPELTGELAHLAWLDIGSAAGQEYWLAMNLAGKYAAANHQVIHRRIARACGLQVITTVENHHNFAWLETLPDGRQVYVHRKGATPAHRGALGVIPGSMGDPGFVVRGRGSPHALNSASHGAGRRLSRNQSFRQLSARERDAYLRERGVVLLGGGLDESPQAYKNIHAVMEAQADLVEIVARFYPRLVMMTDDPRDI
ncbi:MAG: RtcB family protein [Thermoflexales bacterium]